MKETRGTLSLREGIFSIISLLSLLVALSERVFSVIGAFPNFHFALVAFGAFADLALSAEFFTLFANSISERKTREFLFRNGLVDFLSSVPVVVFISGPIAVSWFIALWTGNASAGLFGALSIAYALRPFHLLKGLRIHRLVSLAGPKSEAALKHARIVIIMGSLVVLLTAAASQIFAFMSPVPDTYASEQARFGKIAEVIAEKSGESDVRDAAYYYDEIIAILDTDGSRMPGIGNNGESVFFSAEEYSKLNADGLILFLNARDSNRIPSVFDMTILLAVIFYSILVCSIYTSRFVRSVSSPVTTVTRGMQDPEYYVKAENHPYESPDELTSLSEAYNEHYLPLKEKAYPELATMRKNTMVREEFTSLLGK